MVKEKDCIFCRIKRGEEPTNLLYNDPKCFVILDIFPSQRGHMLVISKDHHETVLSTPDALGAHLLKIAKRFAVKTREKLDATGVKIAINVGRDAGQLVDHTHIHVIPHYNPVTTYSTRPNPKITEEDAKELIRLLGEVSNARAFQRHKLGT